MSIPVCTRLCSYISTKSTCICQFVCLYVYLPVCLSVCVSVCRSACLPTPSACLSIYLHICLCVCLYVCLSVCLSVCISVYLCVSTCISVCVSVCMSFCLSVCKLFPLKTEIYVEPLLSIEECQQKLFISSHLEKNRRHIDHLDALYIHPTHLRSTMKCRSGQGEEKEEQAEEEPRRRI